MDILISVIPFILLVLFVFAILLMVIGLGRYAGYLTQENAKHRSQLESVITAFKFVAFTNISGRLSFFKAFLTSVFVSLLIVLGLFLVKLVGS